MNKRHVNGVLAVAFLGAALALAQVTPQPTPAPTPYYPPVTQYPPYSQYPATPTDTTAKNPLLLALVLQPVLQQGGAALASGVGMLFSRLFTALAGRGTAATTTQPAMPGAYAAMPAYPGYQAAPTPYGAPAVTPTPYGVAPATYPGGPNPYATPGAPTYPGAPAPYGTVGTPPTYPTAPTATYPATSPYPTTSGSPATASYPSAPVSPPVAGYGAPGYPTAAAPTYPAVPTAGAAAGMVGAVPAPGTATSLPAGKAVVLPSVVLSLIQLDPHSYATARRIDLTHGAPTLRTGEVFAIEYAANVSGQVRIDNIDSGGQRTALGTYTVLAGHDNRIPRTKGIQMTGTTGTETFKLYLFPCVPTGADTKAQSNSAGLPACPDSPNPKLLQASKGVLQAKGAVNLESPDPTLAVSAAQDYQPNDITESDFQINHTEAQ